MIFYSIVHNLQKFFTQINIYYGKNIEERKILWKIIFEKSELLQYLNFKTKSANRDSKARGSFANLYALYVIIEDYLQNKFDKKSGYSKYEGVEFTKLFKRQRELPFGTKLQNHAFNNRMNSEFQKFFPNTEFIPILRNLETYRYWINENLLKIKVRKKTFNLANVIIEIIDAYVQIKRDSFKQFIQTCIDLQEIESKNPEEVESFVIKLLAPNVDARLFEIVSYAILKYFYHDQKIFWGFEIDKLNKENLKLFKTGRTNANDGGIDFVMKPLGRFFQVTETIDVKKYFLDIDKIQRLPITFVIKTTGEVKYIQKILKTNAQKLYSIDSIVKKYMKCIEEIINIPILKKRFVKAIKQGYLKDVLHEIIIQSKLEFNYKGKNNEKPLN